jgi:uncharacterized protein YyaL (SSP411 family)
MWRISDRRHAAGPFVMVSTLLLTITGSAVGAPAPADKGRPANRLARETSPYLLMHAHNPVDWYPWGPDAFARARKEGKLVFLSIGYSSCYWCHVMERESFENPDVARLLNQWFVSVKVDREERPDVDSTYMTAINVLGQNGGWPLSMFLTADAKPIVGGTYWPPEDREVNGRKARGFKSILKFIHDWQAEKPDEVRQQADQLAAATAEVLAGLGHGVAVVDLDRGLVTAAGDAVKEEYDPQFGGFGSPGRGFRGPKFPVPSYLKLLLAEAERTKSAELTAMVTHSLDRMAEGGVYDQLGGGFHRYSTERTWTVPHFEKMLYDNAQLAEVYARAYRLTGKPLYRRVVAETLEFVSREMTAPGGGFYSALDAETNGEEGRFYVWTDRELDDALAGSPDAGLFKKVYGADAGPNFEGRYHVLVMAKPLAEAARDLKLSDESLEARLAPLRRKLFEARAARVRPFLDTKVLTGWNGQMIAGYAVAGRELQERRYTEAAARAAEFVLGRLRDKDGRLFRTFGGRPGEPGEARLNGYLEDYAYLVHGLLALHDATAEAKWLDTARALADTMVRRYGDPERGGFFFTSGDHEKLFARAKDQYDSAQPSGNSVAAADLVRLWTKTRDGRYRDLAEKTFKAFAGSLKSNPSSLTAMACGLGLYLDARAAPPPEEPKAIQGGGGAKRSDNVVEVKATADKPDGDGKQTVSVTLTIEPGWHLYANPVPPDFPGIPTTVTVTGAPKPEEVKVEYPKGTLVRDAFAGDHFIYEGTVTVKAAVRRAKGDSGPLEVSIKLQACNKDKCLLPATVKQTVK